MTKKIAILCNYALSSTRIGGMDRFYVAYDKKLKGLGYEAHWFFSEYEPFNFFSDLTIFNANTKQVELYFLEKVVKDNLQYDTLITHFVALNTRFFKKVKLTGIQYIIAVDHIPRPIEGIPFLKRMKNKIRGILYSKYINQFVAVSEYTKKHFLNDYGSFLENKIKVIYNGIDTSIFVKRKEENQNMFILTSHLRASKGIQDLLMALYLLDDGLKSKIHVNIYGKGPYEEELKQLSNQLNLNEIVRFQGSSSVLNELYSKHAYLIHPSYGETFCYSIVESLMSNVPVITTHEAGNVLSIIEENKNGFLFNAGKYKQLAQIIKDIIEKKKIIDTDVDIHIQKKFNLEEMVDNHIKLLL